MPEQKQDSNPQEEEELDLEQQLDALLDKLHELEPDLLPSVGLRAPAAPLLADKPVAPKPAATPPAAVEDAGKVAAAPSQTPAPSPASDTPPATPTPVAQAAEPAPDEQASQPTPEPSAEMPGEQAASAQAATDPPEHAVDSMAQQLDAMLQEQVEEQISGVEAAASSEAADASSPVEPVDEPVTQAVDEPAPVEEPEPSASQQPVPPNPVAVVLDELLSEEIDQKIEDAGIDAMADTAVVQPPTLDPPPGNDALEGTPDTLLSEQVAEQIDHTQDTASAEEPVDEVIEPDVPAAQEMSPEDPVADDVDAAIAAIEAVPGETEPEGTVTGDGSPEDAVADDVDAAIAAADAVSGVTGGESSSVDAGASEVAAVSKEGPEEPDQAEEAGLDLFDQLEELLTESDRPSTEVAAEAPAEAAQPKTTQQTQADAQPLEITEVGESQELSVDDIDQLLAEEADDTIKAEVYGEEVPEIPPAPDAQPVPAAVGAAQGAGHSEAAKDQAHQPAEGGGFSADAQAVAAELDADSQPHRDLPTVAELGKSKPAAKFRFDKQELAGKIVVCEKVIRKACILINKPVKKLPAPARDVVGYVALFHLLVGSVLLLGSLTGLM